MWSKLIVGAAAILAAALFAFLGVRLINAYGNARYQAGFAEARTQQVPAILAANEAAARATLDARDRLIAAERNHGAETARLVALIQHSDDEVNAYEASATSRADCLDAERVRAIEVTRGGLFPGGATTAPSGGEPGPLPAKPAD